MRGGREFLLANLELKRSISEVRREREGERERERGREGESSLFTSISEVKREGGAFHPPAPEARVCGPSAPDMYI